MCIVIIGKNMGEMKRAHVTVREDQKKFMEKTDKNISLKFRQFIDELMEEET